MTTSSQCKVKKERLTAEDYVEHCPMLQQNVMIYATQLHRIIQLLQLGKPLPDSRELTQLKLIDIHIRNAGNNYIDDDADFFAVLLDCFRHINWMVHSTCHDVYKDLRDTTASTATILQAVQVLKGDFKSHSIRLKLPF
jgi:hypothetical protein